MWKLLDPRSTAARTSGTGRGELRGVARASADRVVAATGGGTRAPAGSGGREGGATATGRDCVRVADDELRAFEPFAVVDLRAAQILHTHRVDQELHAEILDAGVAFLDRFVELEAILQPRAPAALHEDAQHELRVTLAADEITHLAGRRIGELERRSVLQRFIRGHGIHMKSV